MLRLGGKYLLLVPKSSLKVCLIFLKGYNGKESVLPSGISRRKMTIEREDARNAPEFLIVAGDPTSINVKIFFQLLTDALYILRVQRMWFSFRFQS